MITISDLADVEIERVHNPAVRESAQHFHALSVVNSQLPKPFGYSIIGRSLVAGCVW